MIGPGITELMLKHINIYLRMISPFLSWEINMTVSVMLVKNDEVVNPHHYIKTLRDEFMTVTRESVGFSC